MCVASLGLLLASIVVLLGLAWWTGYLSLKPANLRRVGQISNRLVFGLLGAVALALLLLAVEGC